WAKRVTATAAPEARRRWWWWWVAPLLVAAAGAGVWIATRDQAPAPATAAPAVVAEPKTIAPAEAPAEPPAPATDAPARAATGPKRAPNLARGKLLDPWKRKR